MHKIIKIVQGAPQVVEDSWEVLRDLESVPSASSSHKIFPLAAIGGAPGFRNGDPVQAIWIAPDDDFESHIHALKGLKLIAVDFPSFRDGRGYSVATMLRARYGWIGELRAIGDVLRDQLNYMRRCGFDSFALRADKDVHDALKSFSHYSIRYQGAVDDPVPLFRRRGEQKG